MKRKAKVVMLPTEKASGLYINAYNKLTSTYHKGFDAQHLYLISDDEIKAGDWYYDLVEATVTKCIKTHDGMVGNGVCSTNKEVCKKVIASTDSELGIGRKEFKTTKDSNGNIKKVSTGYMYKLPTFSEDFIKAYVKANGEIDEVNVEYEDGGLYCTNCGKSEFVCDEDRECQTLTRREGVKLRDDNTVIISMIEERVYSRDEVESLIKSAFIAGGKDCMNSTFDGPDKFIKENL